MKLFLLLFLFFLSFNSYGHGGHGAIMQGDHVKAMKDKFEFKNTFTQIISNDSDDPTVVAKNAAIGSMYIRSTTGVLYQKQDAGSSTNWLPLIIGPSGAGTDECVTRWDGTGVPSLQDSVFCITDTGIGTGLTLDDPSNDIHADDVHILIRNESGATLEIGDAVYVTGYSVGQDRITVDIADADDPLKMPAIGLVEAQILNNDNGEAVLSGGLSGFDTTGGGGWAVADSLYVSTTGTSGNTLTNIKPFANGNLIQAMGKIERDHATSGRMTVTGAGRSNDIPTNLTLPNGGAFRTDINAADTAIFSAYDVDGASYTTFGTLTANNIPTLSLLPTDLTVTNAPVFSAMTANSFIYSGAASTLASTAMTDGQVVVGSTGLAPVVATMSGGATIDNLGAVSLTSTSVVGADLAAIGTPTYSTIQEMQNTVHSVGILAGNGVTDGGAGTVDVGAGSGLIRATDSDVAELLFFDWLGSTGLTLTDSNINYIYIEYNAGTPQIIATTSERADSNTNILLGVVSREGTEVHISDKTEIRVGNHGSAMVRRMLDTSPFATVNDDAPLVGETGTRNISVEAASFWEGLSDFSTAVFDSSGAGVFDGYFYRDGVGGWTKVTAQTQIDNTQYDDGDGTLGILTANRYGVHWIYLEQDGDVSIVYGRGDYFLSQALDAIPPSDLPPQLQVHGKIVGKVIIQKSDAVYTLIESISGGGDFQAFVPTDHNSLITLQGGAASEYYHFDATEFGFLDGQDQSVLIASTPTFAALTIDNMGMNLNTISTTSGNLIFAPTTLITEVTGDLSVSGRIDGEGSKVLGVDPYKQFNKSAYAEYSAVGDFTTGQNATFDGGGVATADPVIITAALDTTDAKYFQYTMGAQHDYFYLTVPVDNDKTIGYRFRYSYDGADDDIDLEIKCATSGVILTDTTPKPVKANSLVPSTGSIFVPSGCGDLKFGFSVAVFNSGKVFKFNRLALTDNPLNYKSLLNISSTRYTGNAGQVLTALVTDIPFATKVVDDFSEWDGTKFTALKDGAYNLSGSVYLVGTISGVLYIYVNGVQERAISRRLSDNIFDFSDTINLSAGDYFSLRISVNQTASNSATLHTINITGITETEHVVSPTSNPGNIFSAQVQGDATPTHSQENADWIEDVTLLSTGRYNVNPKTDFFSLAPNCSVTVVSVNVGRQCRLEGSSPTGITVECDDNSDVPEHNDFEIMCQRQGTDVKDPNFLAALPNRFTYGASIDATEVVTENDDGYVSSCTNADPSVCTLNSSFFSGDPKCWAEPTTAGLIADVTVDTSTSVTIDRTDAATPFKLFCLGVKN